MKCRIRSKGSQVAVGILILLLLAISDATAETLQGKVVRVIDGDTLTVVDAGKARYVVRLAAIDAPESGQPFGARSREHVITLLRDREVTVEWTKKDRFGRLVGQVFAGAEDVGLAQLRQGLAWHYLRFANEQPENERAAYAEAERQARDAGAGLWRERNPVAPWDWRRARSGQE